jgi:hypothetical protein
VQLLDARARKSRAADMSNAIEVETCSGCPRKNICNVTSAVSS